MNIGGLIQYTDLALVGIIAILNRPGIAAPVFETSGKRGINALFVFQSIDLNGNTHVVFCLGSKDLSRTLGLLQPVKESFRGQGLIHNHSVAAVSIFGPDFRERPGNAGMMCGALAKADINVLSMSTSVSRVSCIVDKECLDAAVEVSGDTFELHDR